MTRSTFRVTLSCDNRCLFCAQRGLASADAPAPASTLALLRQVSDELTFVGGEPTLSPALPELVRQAKAAGFTRIGLQTNGRRLGRHGLAATLAAAGLTDVHLSIHGAEPALHDHHAGVAGALDQALAALTASRAEGLQTAVTTVVTRSNYRHLAALVPRLAGAQAWTLQAAQAFGAAADAFDRLVPRLALSMPFVLHALDLAEKRGLVTFLAGVPACLVGPFASRLLPEPGRSFAPVCARCPARAACPGVDPLYLRRYAGDELKPREPFTLEPGHEPLARLFTGLGEVAPGTPPAHLARATGTASASLTPLSISARPRR